MGEIKVVGFGNPLLDTIVKLEDNSLLQKYNLEEDGQKEVSKSDMKALVEDIKDYEKTVIAGGCAQNTFRIMQWLLRNEGKLTMFGAVGDDPEAELLKEFLKRDNVETSYVTQRDYITGTTVSLITGEHRSLVAYLGAAEVVSIDDFLSTPGIKHQIKEATLVYMEGFFLTKRENVATYILDICNKQNKEFAFNLSGEYLCKELPETVKHFITKSDIIFGNLKEFETICPIMNESCVDDLIKSLGKKGKTVAVTNGQYPVKCIQAGEESISEIQVITVDKEVVDTTGAGDAFAGGFLAGYLNKTPAYKCCRLGNYAAFQVIKDFGCNVPISSPIFSLHVDCF